MDMLAAVVAIIGIVVAGLAWHVVATGRDVWRTIPPVFAVLGLLSLLLVPSLDELPSGAGRDVGVALQIALGLASGAVLYVATRGFVVVADRSRTFARQVQAAYGRAEGVSVSTAVGLALLTAVGEELFWRGLVTRVGADRGLSGGVAAVIGWLVYIASDLPSRLLPIIAAAVVGGALWTGLAWWTGGILAPIASHMLWTGLMLGFPPGPPRAEVM
jgi:membrane protease YdiL (CAAX protease family)